jgi:hypothetical protein
MPAGPELFAANARRIAAPLPTVGGRQRQKVSGSDDDLTQIMICVPNSSPNWSWNRLFNALSSLRGLSQSASKAHHLPCQEMNKGTKWANLPNTRGLFEFSSP